MIDPENEIPYDDADNSDTAEQQSQQDIHSNGLGDTEESAAPADGTADPERLEQADRASEAAYTLDLDKGYAPKIEPKEDTNIKD
jgi:hypothetical protein